jgi:hypothetical protein
LADTVLATTIDNIIRFRKPIKLELLRQWGVVDGANLVTARRISSEQAIQIVEEGML